MASLLAWLHLGSVTLTTFLASLVEFVEALTIVLAVATTRGWKSATYGTLAAIIALALIIAVAGPAIQKVPMHWMQLVIGAIVAVFGLRWLKKATLRSAGRIPFHDEDAIYSKEIGVLSGHQLQTSKIDKIATVTTFKAVFLEGFEVAFIVVTAGNVSAHFGPAVAGAALALIVVIILGFALHRPLSKVPENSLKKAVGIFLSAFGLFWVGEGIGLKWPMADSFILILAAGLAVISFSVSAYLKKSDSKLRR